MIKNISQALKILNKLFDTFYPMATVKERRLIDDVEDFIVYYVKDKERKK